ncbi:hypothetical protein BRADI_1g28041v3 [Brachypodium distachyon]|uniref:Uncharacterized protein n=1 Tax=Brachypodium distachyon TaxID=15368 RepID=A0A2K2DLI5_BRADI|nr:hypothetical protein BRADI_1g28041v3 [Brachypodium distachyon]
MTCMVAHHIETQNPFRVSTAKQHKWKSHRQDIVAHHMHRSPESLQSLDIKSVLFLVALVALREQLQFLCM